MAIDRVTGRSSASEHQRRSIRLASYDYTSAGAYFITVVTQERICLFGEVVNGTMRLSRAGQMIEDVWQAIPAHYPGVDIDAFVVMPNHVHGVVLLVGAAPRGRPGHAMSLPGVVHRFKTLTTRRYCAEVTRCGWPSFRSRLWQRNYYEHIVRDDASLCDIREYIATNPARWSDDMENPDRPGR